MEGYSVKQLSEMAQVSIRTLHHYDDIDLLKPGTRTAAGYRLYGEKELLRLQQILFFRELEFTLEEIRQILDDPEFDLVEALQFHRGQLEKKSEQLHILLQTIDKTIENLKEKTTMVTPEEMYQGFTKEQIEEYEREVNEKYDPKIVEESRRRVRNMTKAQWQEIKNESEEVSKGLAALMDRDPGDPDVQKLIERHHAIIGNFYTCTLEIYKGLGDLYVNDERFTANIDKAKPGLAAFMRTAMHVYVERAGQ